MDHHRDNSTPKEIQQCALCCKLDDASLARFVASQLNLILRGHELYLVCKHDRLVDALPAIEHAVKDLLYVRGDNLLLARPLARSVYSYLSKSIEKSQHG